MRSTWLVTDPTLWEFIIKCADELGGFRGGLLGNVQDMPTAKSCLVGLIPCFQINVCWRPRVCEGRDARLPSGWKSCCCVSVLVKIMSGCAVCFMWFVPNKNRWALVSVSSGRGGWRAMDGEKKNVGEVIIWDQIWFQSAACCGTGHVYLLCPVSPPLSPCSPTLTLVSKPLSSTAGCTGAPLSRGSRLRLDP